MPVLYSNGFIMQIFCLLSVQHLIAFLLISTSTLHKLKKKEKEKAHSHSYAVQNSRKPQL